MRTTIRIDAWLLAEAKKHAAENHRTLTAVIEDALRESFLRQRATTRVATKLPTFRGDGLQPGINLDDSADLLDRLEGR